MNKTDIQTAEQAFCNLVNKHITREGIHDLLEYLLNETDFFRAPCSTRYHLSVEGGLVHHSLHVYQKFNALCNTFYPTFPEESRAICALFHDLCKYNSYSPVKKSRKTGRTLPNGKPEWEDYTGYDFDEAFPYGHGEKSVYLLQKYIKLTDEEAMAIRWHMGYSDATFKGGMQSVSNAMKLYPVIALLHSADMIAATEEDIE